MTTERKILLFGAPLIALTAYLAFDMATEGKRPTRHVTSASEAPVQALEVAPARAVEPPAHEPTIAAAVAAPAQPEVTELAAEPPEVATPADDAISEDDEDPTMARHAERPQQPEPTEQELRLSKQRSVELVGKTIERLETQRSDDPHRGHVAELRLQRLKARKARLESELAD